jgi:hypothetical protein
MAAAITAADLDEGGFDGRCTVSLAAIRPGAAQEGADAQGVDLLAAVKTGEAFVRARANCRECDSEGACHDWFLEG